MNSFLLFPSNSLLLLFVACSSVHLLFLSTLSSQFFRFKRTVHAHVVRAFSSPYEDETEGRFRLLFATKRVSGFRFTSFLPSLHFLSNFSPFSTYALATTYLDVSFHLVDTAELGMPLLLAKGESEHGNYQLWISSTFGRFTCWYRTVSLFSPYVYIRRIIAQWALKKLIISLSCDRNPQRLILLNEPIEFTLPISHRSEDSSDQALFEFTYEFDPMSSPVRKRLEHWQKKTFGIRAKRTARLSWPASVRAPLFLEFEVSLEHRRSKLDSSLFVASNGLQARSLRHSNS